MKELNTSELTGEERFEAEAAFGEDSDIIQLEEEDLEPVETPEYFLQDVLEEGDHVSIEHLSGNTTDGEVTETDDISISIDPDEGHGGYFPLGDFRREGTSTSGVINTLVEINGQNPDQVIDERTGDGR